MHDSQNILRDSGEEKNGGHEVNAVGPLRYSLGFSLLAFCFVPVSGAVSTTAVVSANFRQQTQGNPITTIRLSPALKLYFESVLVDILLTGTSTMVSKKSAMMSSSVSSLSLIQLRRRGETFGARVEVRGAIIQIHCVNNAE